MATITNNLSVIPGAGSSNISLGTVNTPLAAPIAGQIKIATTGTAVPLPSAICVNGVVIKSKTSNNATGGFVGPTGVTMTDDGTGNGYKILPGEGYSAAITNMNTVYVNGTIGDIFYYAGN